MSQKIFFGVLSILLLALNSSVDAQQPAKVRRIGRLGTGSSADPYSDAFRQGLRELGYVEGQNIVIEYRYADGKNDRLPDLAADLVRLKVDVILVGGSQAILAVKKATTTIPVVMGAASDPVGTGLVASLARPGGNITGLTLLSPELSGKRLELLKEVVTGSSRVAVLSDASNPGANLMLDETREAGKSLGLKLQIREVCGANDFDSIFAAFKKERAQAVNVLSSSFFNAHRNKIVALATNHKLPAIYSNDDFIEDGGLMSYGANISALYRRAAIYVDKILKGAKPADLPVEQPTKFELVINLKAAKQIGLTVPPNMLARADKVIK